MGAYHSEVLQKLLSKSINLIVPVRQKTTKLQVSVHLCSFILKINKGQCNLYTIVLSKMVVTRPHCLRHKPCSILSTVKKKFGVLTVGAPISLCPVKINRHLKDLFPVFSN